MGALQSFLLKRLFTKPRKHELLRKPSKTLAEKVLTAWSTGLSVSPSKLPVSHYNVIYVR